MSRAKVFDISWWQQDKIDFPAAKADGYDAVICRASHGMKLDETFQPNIAKARAEGFVLGAYHYIYVDQGLQAQHIKNQVDAVGGVHFPIFLDVERFANESASVAQWKTVLNQNFKYLDDLGIEAGIYTSFWMWQDLTRNLSLLNGKPVGERMMWVADWRGRPEPQVPVGWNWWELYQQGSTLRPEWNHNLYPYNSTDFGEAILSPEALRQKYLGEEPPPEEPHTHEQMFELVYDNKRRLDAIKSVL